MILIYLLINSSCFSHFCLVLYSKHTFSYKLTGNWFPSVSAYICLRVLYESLLIAPMTDDRVSIVIADNSFTTCIARVMLHEELSVLSFSQPLLGACQETEMKDCSGLLLIDELRGQKNPHRLLQ